MRVDQCTKLRVSSMSLGVIFIDTFLYLLLQFNLASVFYLIEREEHGLLCLAEQEFKCQLCYLQMCAFRKMFWALLVYSFTTTVLERILAKLIYSLAGRISATRSQGIAANSFWDITAVRVSQESWKWLWLTRLKPLTFERFASSRCMITICNLCKFHFI